MSGSSLTRAGDRRPDMVAFLAILVAVLVVQAAPPADIVSLAVPGRSNSTPSVAATGSFVAVAWGASSAGKSDVYLAVSNNSGQSFGEPVRVNTVAGEARLGGELRPRVALFSTGKSAAPEIAVVWTTRSETATELKLSRSRDGGRTFERAATLQSQAQPVIAVGRHWRSTIREGHTRSGSTTAVWRPLAPPARRMLAIEPVYCDGRRGHGRAIELVLCRRGRRACRRARAHQGRVLLLQDRTRGRPAWPARGRMATCVSRQSP